MAASNITILDLSLDAWADIGRNLADADLARASLACSSLHEHVVDNQSLWSYKFQERWGDTSQQLSGVHSWPGIYRASCLAATQFSTKNPWTVQVCRPYAAEPPAAAQVLVRKCSSSSASGSHASEVMSLAASLDQKLLWLRTSSSAGTSPAVQLPQEEQYAVLQAELDDTAAAAADGLQQANNRQQKQQAALSCKLRSDLQHGHTAFIDALVEVPAANSIGYASGSRDKTIKLWAPFSGSSSSFADIRPVRTLRSHTGSITALLVLPASGLCSSSNSCCACSSSSSSGSYGSYGSTPPLLASASADKTIKIWSLASLGPNTTAAVSSNSEAGEDLTSQTVESGSSSTAGSSKGSLKQSNNAGKAARQQPGRNPLLATLRGHSDCVSGLMLDLQGRECDTCKQCGSFSTGANKLLSCSRDCRVKQWDINSQSCIATWKLPAPCFKLLEGLDVSNGCVAAVGSHAIMVLDTRVKGGTSGTGTAGVLRVQWSSGTLACAAACGTMLAGGGRKGVRVWDIRAQPQDSSCGGLSNSSSNSQVRNSRQPASLLNAKIAAGKLARNGLSANAAASSRGESTFDSRLLFSASMPNNAPVSAMHMNRVRLVAATSKVVLHSPASIAVWSVPEGRRLQPLSSTESAVNVQAARSRSWHNNDYADDAWELIQALSEPDADEAIRLMHQQQQQQHEQQQQPEEVQAQGNQWPPGIEQQQQQQQPHPLHAAVAAVHPPGVDPAQAHSDLDDSDSNAGSELSRGEGQAATACDNDEWATGSVESSSAAASSFYGRIEPGVVAMDACGQVMATVDTLGNILLRDFSKGQPRRQHLIPYCTTVGSTSTSASSNKPSGGSSSTSTAADSLADSSDGSNDGKHPPGNHQFFSGEVEARRAAAHAAAAAATGLDAMHLSKFWRS